MSARRAEILKDAALRVFKRAPSGLTYRTGRKQMRQLLNGDILANYYMPNVLRSVDETWARKFDERDEAQETAQLAEMEAREKERASTD